MIARLIISAIRFYQRRISPTNPPCCRFTPTCSQYALTAIERFGAWKGGWLALWRILQSFLQRRLRPRSASSGHHDKEGITPDE